MTGRQNARIKEVFVLSFIHVAHFAYLQCREAQGIVGGLGSRLPERSLWMPMAELKPGTSTSVVLEVLDRRSLPHDKLTKCADKKQCWCCLLSMLRTPPISWQRRFAMGLRLDSTRTDSDQESEKLHQQSGVCIYMTNMQNMHLELFCLLNLGVYIIFCILIQGFTYICKIICTNVQSNM